MSIVLFKGNLDICQKEATKAQNLFGVHLHCYLQNLSFDYLLNSLNDVKF